MVELPFGAERPLVPDPLLAIEAGEALDARSAPVEEDREGVAPVLVSRFLWGRRRRFAGGMSHTATEGYEALRPVLSVNEAARVLGIERATLYRLLRAGELESVRVGKRQKFRPEDLEEYLERGRGREP